VEDTIEKVIPDVKTEEVKSTYRTRGRWRFSPELDYAVTTPVESEFGKAWHDGFNYSTVIARLA
jgi:hypothetical protein